jgi:hypothetical protein
MRNGILTVRMKEDGRMRGVVPRVGLVPWGVLACTCCGERFMFDLVSPMRAASCREVR